jgi:hypothetical protein
MLGELPANSITGIFKLLYSESDQKSNFHPKILRFLNVMKPETQRILGYIALREGNSE